MKFLPFNIDVKYNVQLKINQNNNFVSGELILSPSKLPKLRIIESVMNNEKLYSLLSKKNNLKLITCKSGNENFTLIDCDIYDDLIYPKYIILGNPFTKYIDLKFNGAYICLKNFNEWFINKREIKNSVKGFKNNISMKAFKFKIKTRTNRIIEISNRYNCVPKQDDIDKQKIFIEEFPTIIIKPIDDSFSLDEIINFDYDIRMIFSFLIGEYSNTLYLWGSIKDENGYNQLLPIYYSCNYILTNGLSNYREGLMQYRYLIENKKFKPIFSNYFSNINFTKVWSRLFGILSYSGIWQYEILGYVSILNKYVESYSKGKGEVFPESSFKYIKDGLVKKLEELLKDIKKTDTNENISKTIKNSILKIPNTDIVSFQDKFDLWFSKINNDIKQIINFTKADFKVLKEIRDAAAHGKNIDYGYDLTGIYKLNYKLTLLLYHLVYLDLGLSGSDFLQNLSLSIHSLIRNSDINQKHLDRVSGRIDFIKVDDTTFAKIKLCKKYDIILEKNIEKELYIFNYELTKFLQNNWPKVSDTFHDVRDYIKHLYSGNVNEVIYKTAYIENKNEAIMIFGLCIVVKMNYSS